MHKDKVVNIIKYIPILLKKNTVQSLNKISLSKKNMILINFMLITALNTSYFLDRHVKLFRKEQVV